MVVLDQHQSDSEPRWFDAAAGPHRGLLQRPQPGQGLAGVPDPAAVAGGVDEPAGERGDAREVAEEVERGALAGEDRPQRAGRPRPTFVPGAIGVAVVDRATSTCTRGSSCANTSVAHAVPASTPSARADEVDGGAVVGAAPARGEVAERPESSASARRRAPRRRAGRVGLASCRSCAARARRAGSGTNVGRGPLGEHEPAEERGRRLGEVGARVRAARSRRAVAAAHERACRR